jgi:hypothetical protein
VLLQPHAPQLALFIHVVGSPVQGRLPDGLGALPGHVSGDLGGGGGVARAVQEAVVRRHVEIAILVQLMTTTVLFIDNR